MKTYVHTKIYAIRRSAKGWSEYFKFYYSKEKAVKECRDLQNWAAEQTFKQNFRVIELTCEDTIIYKVD